MTYDESETGIATSRPVEVYKFIGSFATYRYTSEDNNVTVGGEVYLSTALKREALRVATQDDEQIALDIEVPVALQVVQDYGFTSSPPDLDLEIRRVHWGLNFASDAVLIWTGPVNSISIDNQRAKLRSASLFTSALASPLPPRFYQKVCNHVLYDARCTVNPASFTKTDAVVGVIENGTVIDVDDDGFADGVLIAGEMISNRTGERRLITAQASNVITINFPFADLITGDEVTLRAGCDHSFATCGSKFSNQVNFGGHPFIPDDNPFEGEL